MRLEVVLPFGIGSGGSGWGGRVPCGCVWVECVVVGVGFVTSAILTLARLMA